MICTHWYHTCRFTSWTCSMDMICTHWYHTCRSQWPRGLRRRSAAARLLKSWVRIPPGAWMFVRCECCVLSGRGLPDELITRPEESYRLWCGVVCDLETSRMRPWPRLGRSATEKKKNLTHDVIVPYSPVRKGSSENHATGNTMSLTPSSCTRCTIGSWK